MLNEGLKLCGAGLGPATSATTTAPVASSVAPAPSAQADPADTKFLSDIGGIGVPQSPAELIARARMMCRQYSDGASDDQVNQSISAAYPDWSDFQAVEFMADAVSDYCPQYLTKGGR